MPADPAAVKALFLEAAEMADRPARAAFLADRCGGDADLLRRVTALLAAHDRADEDDGTQTHNAPTVDRPPGDELLGTVIAGQYKLIEVIGEGGMGAVYMAQQTEPVKRAVAVKVIKAGMDSKAVLARFEAERQALAMMDHPNIAKVLDAGVTQPNPPTPFPKREGGESPSPFRGGVGEGLSTGRPFFVMELVKGIPITTFCDDRKLTPRERLELFVPVCQAIQHAHQKGVIHRDIKPSNVLVAMYDDRPVPKVIDFGVAKAAGQPLTDKTLMTGFGAVVGTPEYMSPEQASFNQMDVDTRSDVYALGVLLYELLTGTTPVDKKSLGRAAVMELLRIIRETDPPKPSTRLSTDAALPTIAACRNVEPAKLSKLLKGELDWIVMKALEKDRARRYETANGLAKDVQRYLADEAVEACPPTWGYRVRKAYRKNRPAVLVGGAFAALVMTGLVATSYGLYRAEREAERANAAERNAVDNAVKATAAAEAEKAAKESAVAEKDRAVKAEADAQAVLEFVTNRVFAAAAPIGAGGNGVMGVVGLGKDVTLRQALDAAEPHIAKDFAQVPRAEVSLRKTLGAVYHTIENHPQASTQYSQALTVARQKLGENDPLTVSVEVQMAFLLRNTFTDDLAFGRLEDVLTRLERQSPRDEPTIRKVVEALYFLYSWSGEKEKARRTRERLAATAEPPNDPVKVISREADALFGQERWSEAAVAYQRALDEMKVNWRPAYHRERYVLSRVLVECLRLAGRHAEAMALGRQRYDECRADFGPHDALTENLADALTNLFLSTTPTAEHAEFMRARLNERTDKWGLGHAMLARDVSNISHIYGLLGRHDEAITLLESYTAAIPEPKRAGIPMYVFVVINLSEAYAAVGRRREAVAVVTDHIGRLRQFGLGDSSRQGAVNDLTERLIDLREWPAAVRTSEDVLAERRKIDPPDWRVFGARVRLGRALAGAKDYTAAARELEAGYRGLTDPAYPLPDFGSDWPRFTADRIIRLYTDWGKPDEAAKWRAERAKYPPEKAPPPRAGKS